MAAYCAVPPAEHLGSRGAATVQTASLTAMYPPGFTRRRQSPSAFAEAHVIERAFRPDQIESGRRERRRPHVGADRVEPKRQSHLPSRRGLLRDERRVEIERRHVTACHARQLGRAAAGTAPKVQHARLRGQVSHHGQCTASGCGVAGTAARRALEDLEEPRHPAWIGAEVVGHARDCSPMESVRWRPTGRRSGSLPWWQPRGGDRRA